MKVTTSRGPSAKSRRFGKALASFLSLPYVNRGRQSPGEEDAWLVVVENHGNPGGLVKRYSGKEELLSFTLSLEPVAGRLKRLVPVVIGAQKEALPIAKFFQLEWLEGPAFAHEGWPKRTLAVSSERIDFIDDGEAKFRLKI
jgi:rRNA maturation protein Rpf1